MPNLYIIAGPNGAGKTTASYTILPEVLHCYEFINADEIARGISPFHPESAAFEAGRIMLQQIDKHLNQEVDFAIETTLSTRYYLQLIKQAKKKGYTVKLIFIYLESAHIATERVLQRVLQGGHDIPLEIIKRRFERGLYNFFNLFQDVVDSWILVDSDFFKIIAISENGITRYHFENIYKAIKDQANEKSK